MCLCWTAAACFFLLNWAAQILEMNNLQYSINYMIAHTYISLKKIISDRSILNWFCGYATYHSWSYSNSCSCCSHLCKQTRLLRLCGHGGSWGWGCWRVSSWSRPRSWRTAVASERQKQMCKFKLIKMSFNQNDIPIHSITTHWFTHQKGVYQFRYSVLPRCVYQILLLSLTHSQLSFATQQF